MEQTGGPPLTKKWVGKHYLGKGARCAAADGHDDDPETQETVTVPWRGARTAAASAHSSGCPNDRRLICTTRGPQPPKHPPPLALRCRNLRSRSPRRDVSPSTTPDHGAQFRPQPPKLNTRPPQQSESNPVPYNFQFDLTDVPLEDTLLCASSHNVFFYQAHEQLSESK